MDTTQEHPDYTPFWVTLTIDGTQYENHAVEISNPEKTIWEFINAIIEKFELPKRDEQGYPIIYQLAKMEGQEWHISEAENEHCRIGDWVKPNDQLRLVTIETQRVQDYSCESDYGLAGEESMAEEEPGRTKYVREVKTSDWVEWCSRSAKYNVNFGRHLPNLTAFQVNHFEEPFNVFSYLPKIIHREDSVYSSVFAPAEVRRNSRLLVQVFLHLEKETKTVCDLAQETDDDAGRRYYTPLTCALKEGDKVDVQLDIYGKTLLMSERTNPSLVWRGSFIRCSFDYYVPKDIDLDELSCKALLLVNDIPVGEMRFITKIVDAPKQLYSEIISQNYRKVFISYSHKDEPMVMSFHEGLKLAGIEHFFDRQYLKTGDVFPQVIQDYINSADLFVLFWSENAAKSAYVQRELALALPRAFPQIQPMEKARLRIYPLSIKPHADLPDDMKDTYNFTMF